ncbi:MAG: hypothetical protein P8M65_12595 [Roseibacillus sp.]|nr:hypothetical protein [Roseibacillus sp.]
MKILYAVTAIALTGIFSSPRAEAGPCRSYNTTFRTASPSYGPAVYAKRYLRGYDYHGRPIFAYARAPLSHGHACQTRSRYYSPRPRAVIPRAIPCAPPRVIVRSPRPLSRSSGVSFRFSFGGRR